jgi:RimJ/RimL family protein N-acetyltransferase
VSEFEHLTGEVLFTTDRLRCRKWLASDLDALFEVYSDEEGSRYVGDGQPITQSECEYWLGVTAANYKKRGYGMFALEACDSGQVIGFCGLVHPGDQIEAEIKYAFLKSQWGQGLASELVPAMLVYGEQSHQLRHIIATVAAGNLASQRVLLKSGMTFIKDFPEEDGSTTQLYEWIASQCESIV